MTILKKLKRKELLEMMLEQQILIEKQEQEINKMKSELESRSIKIKASGNLAEAALQLSGIFEAAQAAADIYLANIEEQSAVKGMDDDTKD
nr:hypothetical protein [Streptococcus halichoeri]